MQSTKCIVCCDPLESTSLTGRGDPLTVKKFGDLYNTFGKYMNVQDEFKNCFDFRKEPFPFCRYCKLMLTQLFQLHEQSEYLSKLITQMSAQFSSMILESENKENEGKRSKRRKVGLEEPNLTKIMQIRQSVMKQFGASLNLPKDMDSQSPTRKSPVKAGRSIKIEKSSVSVSDECGFSFGPMSEDVVEDLDEDGGDGGPLTPGSFQGDDGDDSQDLGAVDTDDPDYQLSTDDREMAPSPSPIKPRIKVERERIKDLGENKFLFENQIPFEIVDGVYKCGACEFVCGERKELLCHHIPKEHLGAEGERVPITKKLEDNKFLYREKFPFELIDDVYHCGTCSFTSNRKDGVQQHIKVRHFIGKERKNRQFKLEETEPGKFIYAEKFTFQQIDGGFKCDTCQSTKERRVKMLLHLRSVHMEPLNVHGCDKCGKLFRERRKLVQHLATHSSDRPFICDLCGKGFKLQIVLHIHKKKHAGDEAKKHVCEICGKRFWNNFTLKEHVTTHTGEKVFECPICLKAFSRNATRKLHMELHNLDKAFMCELCGRSYSSQIHLNRHISSHKRDRRRKRKSPLKKEQEEEEAPQEVEIEAPTIVEHFLEL